MTSHKRVIARIVGIPDESAQSALAGVSGLSHAQRRALLRLMGDGASQWRGGKPRGGPGHARIEGRPMADLLLEDRG